MFDVSAKFWEAATHPESSNSGKQMIFILGLPEGSK
jgi:hypothetical protein